MTKLGRNDACHCGSGKKYKKCHLDSDQRNQAGARTPRVNADTPSASLDLQRLPQMFRQLTQRGSAADRRKSSELLAESEPIIEYLTRREEIEAAAAQLETHRAEFEELMADTDRFAAFAQTLFAEECLASLRFTSSDVRRAFEHVGYPGLLSQDEQTLETLRAAILHVADKERRHKLSMQLLARLPEFVAAGRCLEAWLLQFAAIQTAENQDETNLFLFHMFSFGYKALAAEKQARDESFIRQFGFDLESLRAMSLDELDAFIESHASDPAKTAALEAFFSENPQAREESVANLEAMQRNASELLEREDGRHLLLTGEEVRPWIPRFNDRFNQSEFGSQAPDAALSEEQARKLFQELALPMMREMAGTIFTRDRISRLVTDLKKYRSDRYAAGDKETPGLAMGAIAYLEREDSPDQNTFLLTLCWRSIGSALKASTAETEYAGE